MKTALINGISGQDGAYLARLLLTKGYRVLGASRDPAAHALQNLRNLGVLDQIEMHSMSGTDFRSVLEVVARTNADEIYNLAGQSSVGLSFEQPVETLESISVATLNFLEVIRFLGRPIRFYSAGSSEIFGNIGDAPADENSPFRPRSPYGVAKATAFWQVANYREAYSLFACTGILFNHESPLRHERFVTQKIIRTACRIAAGNREELRLGNLDIVRDWGWAPEYVEAMWLMLQQEIPRDYVIATGSSLSLADFVDEAFKVVGLEWRKHVIIDPVLLRPTDLKASRANPSRAKTELGWSAKTRGRDVARLMADAERARIPVGSE